MVDLQLQLSIKLEISYQCVDRHSLGLMLAIKMDKTCNLDLKFNSKTNYKIIIISTRLNPEVNPPANVWLITRETMLLRSLYSKQL